MLVNDPKELEKIREKEMDTTRDRIKMILDAGANVVLTTKGIDDMALKCATCQPIISFTFLVPSQLRDLMI